MKYREKLLELIFDDNENAMMEWIEAQPILEQPDIFRELKAIGEEAAAENGDDINEMVEGFKKFDELIDHYEDTVLDEKLAEAQVVMAEQDLDKTFQEMDESIAGVREYIMNCIVNNEDNADAMRELAKKMMQSENDHDLYDPKNWSRIL